MTTADQLRAARDLIADPERWTQGAEARNKLGHPVSPTDRVAVRWCVMGAMKRVGCADHSALGALRLVVYPGWVNDRSDPDPAICHHNVIDGLGRAIEIAEEAK